MKKRDWEGGREGERIRDTDGEEEMTNKSYENRHSE